MEENNKVNVAGFTYSDIPTLEKQAKECRANKKICIISGAVLSAIAITIMIVVICFYIKEVSKGLAVKELEEITQGYDLGLTVLGLFEAIGNGLAIGGGVSNHCKAKRRESIIAQLKAIPEKTDY